VYTVQASAKIIPPGSPFYASNFNGLCTCSVEMQVLHWSKLIFTNVFIGLMAKSYPALVNIHSFYLIL